ncbi:hypothetical protein GCM10028784_32490 [Myceligenerans cantabricum]
MIPGPTTAVALGDSITAGVGDVVGPDARYGPGWAAHLAEVLQVESFRNLAHNGSRARDIAGGQLTEALRLRPALATVLVGGNDVLRSDFSAPEIELALARTVDTLTGAGTAVVLVRLPVIGLFELAPRLVRRVMRRRVALVNAAVDAAAARARKATDHVLVVDGARAIAHAGAAAWHIDRVHPSPTGHRRLALGVARAWLDAVDLAGPTCTVPATGAVHEVPTTAALPSDADLAARLPDAPDPPSRRQRARWLVTQGIPWTWRRGGDFLPGLIRAVAADLRSERALSAGSAIAGITGSGPDPRKRLRRRN